MIEHIDMEEAKRLLDRLPVSLKTETVALSESLDRVLAEDCFSRLAVPPFDKSPFDGYACRAEDTPGRLCVVGVAAAGGSPLPSLGRREAIRIFTGAPLPTGADTIVKQENVTASEGKVMVPSACVPGQNVIEKRRRYPAGRPPHRQGDAPGTRASGAAGFAGDRPAPGVLQTARRSDPNRHRAF